MGAGIYGSNSTELILFYVVTDAVFDTAPELAQPVAVSLTIDGQATPRT